MKILRIIESFYPYVSGPANQAFMVSKLLNQRGFESHILTTKYNAQDAVDDEVMDGIEIERFPINYGFMKYLVSSELKKTIPIKNPEMIHCHNYRSHQTQCGFKYAKENNIPFILNTHGSLLGYKSIVKGWKQWPYIFYDLFYKKIVLEADAVIVSSKQEKNEALEFGVDEKRIKVIPMGADVKDYDSIKKTRVDGKYVLLFVGRISKDRNIMPILEALTLLKDKNIEFRVVGGEVKRSDTDKGGYLDYLKKYTKDNNLNVKFLGAKYDDDLKREYRNADVFVYTSIWENFGQTLLEAACCGLPIISTPVGVAKELIEENKNGFIVEIEDLEKISEKIEILKDKKLREVFGKYSRELVIEKFSWHEIIMQYEKVYYDVKK